MKSIIPFLLFLVIFLLGACSAEKNTLTSKTYHNLASHYNGYFYAKEEITKVEQGYLKSMVDDYNRILRLYPKLDSTQSKGYEKELQEVVKMASLAIQRHQNSKWVDDSYILVGKARLYSLDWGNAIQTFKFVNTNSKDNNARHEAILNLMRTFTEHEEYNNAKAAADFLTKAKLSEAHKKQLYLEKAYLAQTQDDLDNMVRNLTEAAPLLQKKADRPGRIYFIIGQVYQKLGFEAEAYNYYKKCLSTHPEYEVDFYARLYLAQVTEISKSKNINAARKSFRKLLKDSKNRDFKDKIYYEMGVFEYKQKNIDPTISNFNLAIRIGTNKRVDGEAYLRLGEMYYETKKYELSQAYYDSAVNSLPADYENLATIKKRQEILDEFVNHLTTVRWQDSLLSMSQMDTSMLRLHVDSVVKANTKVEPVAKRKKKDNRIQIEQNAPSVFASNESAENTDASAWYFANASSVALGQSEFVRVWGNTTLEDNWRRSQRTVARAQNAVVENDFSNDPVADTDGTVANPAEAILTKLATEIPYTDEGKSEALKKIEEAYYHLGDIYSLKLEEPLNAIETYEKLLNRFPSSDYSAEVLYRLYILSKESAPSKAPFFASQLKNSYPESSWTKLLLNPEYLLEAGKVAVRQKALYAIAYNQYQTGNYDSARLILDNAQTLGLTSFTPNLSLLQIMIIGKSGSVDTYKSSLEAFIKEYPDHELNSFAKKLLDSSSKLKPASKEDIGAIYTFDTKNEHVYAIVYAPESTLDKVVTESLQSFNTDSFPNQKLTISQSQLTNEKTLCIVSEFNDSSSALAYIKLFNEKLSTMNSLKNYNFNNFVISKDNLETLKRTQALNEYLTFYTRNYQNESQ